MLRLTTKEIAYSQIYVIFLGFLGICYQYGKHFSSKHITWQFSQLMGEEQCTSIYQYM